jgi:hypothetical protein
VPLRQGGEGATLPPPADAFAYNTAYNTLPYGVEEGHPATLTQSNQWLQTFAAWGALGTLLGALSTLALGRKGASPQRAANNLAQQVEKTLHSPPVPPNTYPPRAVEISSYITKPPLLLFFMPMVHPQLSGAMALYALVGLVGFVGGNALEGAQEAWVRWEESCIRAQLVGRLGQAFRQSIERKQQDDDHNRAATKGQLLFLMAQAGVSHPEAYLQPQLRASSSSSLAKVEERGEEALPNPATDRLFPYTPQLRLPQSPSIARQATPRFAAAAPQEATPAAPPTPWLEQGQGKVFVNGLGFLGGASVGSLASLVLKQLHRQAQQVKQATLAQQPTKGLPNTPEVKLYVNPNEWEGAFIEGFSHVGKSNLGTLAGLLGLGALLGIGRLAVTGFREIEVTRLNANTEVAYQTYRLQSLDPLYRQMTEQTELEHELAKFKEDLPTLRNNPQALHARCQAILGSVGYWAAPNWISMTPIVQLAAARS